VGYAIMPLDAGDIAHANASFPSLPLLYMTIGIQSSSHAQVLTGQYDTFRTGADLRRDGAEAVERGHP
jgi:hypothetical protein